MYDQGQKCLPQTALITNLLLFKFISLVCVAMLQSYVALWTCFTPFGTDKQKLFVDENSLHVHSIEMFTLYWNI